MRRLALPLVLTLASALPALAEEDGAPAPKEDEFKTDWFGGRVSLWLRPAMDIKVRAGGRNRNGSLDRLEPTHLDPERDLGLQRGVRSSWGVDLDEETILDLEVFYETRFLAFRVWATPPFEYRGQTTLSREMNFGGVTFDAGAHVKSRFQTFSFGAEVGFSVLNFRYLRLAPTVGLRAVAFQWDLRPVAPIGGARANSRDFDTQFIVDNYRFVPCYETGLDLRAGIRDLFEVGLRCSGGFPLLSASEQGTVARIELSATLYPIPYLGLQVGLQAVDVDLKSNRKSENRGWSYDHSYQGAFVSVLVRF